MTVFIATCLEIHSLNDTVMSFGERKQMVIQRDSASGMQIQREGGVVNRFMQEV